MSRLPRLRFVRTLVCVAVFALGVPPLLPAALALEVVGYEISVAEIEAGRLRHLAERLAKQNVLYQLRLGSVRKEDLAQTATRIDRVIETLENGSPGYSVPAPWTRAIRDQLEKVDHAWAPLRSIAVASQLEYLRRNRQFRSLEARRSDPLMIDYFDGLAASLIEEVEALMKVYDGECNSSALSAPELCVTASISGYNAMLSERATKEATYIVAGIDPARHRKVLAETMENYYRARKAIADMPFIAHALSPDRGESAAFAQTLLNNVRSDWNQMASQFEILNAGDAENFDLPALLSLQDRMVGRIERFTAALVRYANIAYGA